MEKFYLVTGSVNLLKLLVPVGVKLVQLRIKDAPIDQLRQQITEAKLCCQQYGATLVLNDYWQLALELGIDFVHLGQEDLQNADFSALRRANIRFGLSTHDEAELELALSLTPAYVALGPVYPTKLKKMKWGPQGLHRVRLWKQIAGQTPLVAIGGITPQRVAGVLGMGADSVAVVTDIQLALDPVARCQEWLRAIKKVDYATI
ncbi:thiamine phosphate synthase [Commensalibacter oyaizuii]|uniref:Thiamine-phosphate synthase n=1 Tax=Commensalibacter oyaizuii TaxID=3043873 RepID=A0ABT6Q2K2_9PROT|nr:thiamine phosphate synthase [Commensalibacter sp. TBRC 16381]MDI2091357.1 thiamine phosphate synthase [Commensalibacter sp. TBRC 16381]